MTTATEAPKLSVVTFEDTNPPIRVERKSGKPMLFRWGRVFGLSGYYLQTKTSIYRLFVGGFYPDIWIGRFDPIHESWYTVEARLGAIGFKTVKGEWRWK